MPSRRPHAKSRLGCAQCKARRVKCDETYPRCRNCQRFAKDCSYGWADPTTLSATALRTITTAHTASPDQKLTFDALDMKLMHHYSTSTAASLSLLPEVQSVWQHSIPDLAYEQPLLMHGLLALSGTHLAYSNRGGEDLSQNRFYVRALHHQQLGLQIYRHQLQHLQDTTVTHETLVCFSAMLCILTLAQLQATSEKFVLQDALDIFTALRGKRALWMSGSAPRSNEMAKLLYKPHDSESKMFETSLTALERLRQRTNNPVLVDAIAVLRTALVQVGAEFRMVGSWPTSVSEEFINLLKARDSVALQIWQLYCNMLDSLRRLWWVEDCGEKFRKAIEVDPA